MKRMVVIVLLLSVVVVGLTALGSAGIGPIVITKEGEQKIILMFGKSIKVTKPGVFVRVPILMEAETYPSLKLYLNVDPESIQTRDQERIVIDNYVVWQIVDPVAFRGSFPEGIEVAGQQINRVVKAAVREVIGKRTLLEVLTDERENIRLAITERVSGSLAGDGIAVADVRITRTELPSATEKNVFARMATDRERLARKSRAEGEEKARTIRAEADREARVTIANAYKAGEIAKGAGDAEATRIYAEAYARDPELFAFLRSMEAYKKTIGEGTTLVLSPKSEFFRYLDPEPLELPAAVLEAPTPPAP
jgi:membrane protease subunit HflC